MASRLGDVLYWAFSALAAAVAGLAAYGMVAGTGNDRFIVIGVFGVIAALLWLAGRACRYVLAAR